MSEFKTILQLNKDADDRDQPYIDTIKGQLVALIDSTSEADEEYTIDYDFSVELGTLPDLQQERIKLKIITRLRNLSYRATINNEILTIKWTIATLSRVL